MSRAERRYGDAVCACCMAEMMFDFYYLHVHYCRVDGPSKRCPAQNGGAFATETAGKAASSEQ